MKKLLALMLAALLLLSLVACGDKKEEEDDGAGLTPDTIREEVVAENGDVFTYESIDSETVRVTGFSGASAPHAVVVPAKMNDKTVTEIGEAAFKAASNISVLTLPEGLLKIGNAAFAYSAIAEINLPASLTTIETLAFAECKHLSKVNFAAGSTLAALPEYCFINSGLTSINIPASVRMIGTAAFVSNKNLATVVVNEGTQVIGSLAFQGCEALASLTLPASVVELGSYVFGGADALAMSGVTVPAESVAAAYIAEMDLPATPPVAEE